METVILTLGKLTCDFSSCAVQVPAFMADTHSKLLWVLFSLSLRSGARPISGKQKALYPFVLPSVSLQTPPSITNEERTDWWWSLAISGLYYFKFYMYLVAEVLISLVFEAACQWEQTDMTTRLLSTIVLLSGNMQRTVPHRHCGGCPIFLPFGVSR